MGIIRRRLVSLFVVAIIVMVGGIAYVMFGTPDSMTIATTRATNSARRAMLEQDWEGALNILAEAKDKADHTDWELLTWYAVLLEKSGVASDAIIAEANPIADPEELWITYGMVAILADAPLLALKAGQELTTYNPDSVQGYFLVAQSYDIQEELPKALEFYGHTLNKIDDVGGNEGIYITVRQRVAQINIELMEQELICC